MQSVQAHASESSRQAALEAKLAGMQQQLDSRQDAFHNLQGDLDAMEAHHKQVCKLCAVHVRTILSLQVSTLCFGKCCVVPCAHRRIDAGKSSIAALSVFALCYFDPAACACQ